MSVTFIFFLFAYWFAVWGIFNFLLVPRHISIIKGGIKSSIYFFLVTLPPLVIIISLGKYYFILFALLQIVAILIPLKSLQTHRNLLSDIIFQQSMLYLLFAYLTTTESLTHFLYFIAAVSLSHLPIFLLKHVSAKGKLIILVALPIAASIIYFAFRSLQSSMSLLIALTIHFTFYLILLGLPRVRKLGIII